MKFWSQLGERELDIDVEVEERHLEVNTGERRLAADFVPLPGGEVYSLLIDGHVHEVAIEEDAAAIWVTIHGQRHKVAVRHPLEKTLREVRRTDVKSAGEIVESPIPGLVVAIKVEVGDVVPAGAAVAIVEAMKMQNELTVQQPGIVEAIHVTERQTVEAGQKLVTLRPASTS